MAKWIHSMLNPPLQHEKNSFFYTWITPSRFAKILSVFFHFHKACFFLFIYLLFYQFIFHRRKENTMCYCGKLLKVAQLMHGRWWMSGSRKWEQKWLDACAAIPKCYPWVTEEFQTLNVRGKSDGTTIFKWRILW